MTGGTAMILGALAKQNMAPGIAMMLGALTMAAAVAGAFFLRFWRRTRDRLFLLFAIAFLLMGVNWLLMPVVGRDEIESPLLYLLRLIAFIIILIGIADKNRAHPKS